MLINVFTGADCIRTERRFLLHKRSTILHEDGHPQMSPQQWTFRDEKLLREFLSRNTSSTVPAWKRLRRRICQTRVDWTDKVSATQ